MNHMTIVAFALIATTGIAQAQQAGAPAPRVASCADPHTVTLTDEYGFKYDGNGDRLNAQGCVIAPPKTPDGANVAAAPKN